MASVWRFSTWGVVSANGETALSRKKQQTYPVDKLVGLLGPAAHKPLLLCRARETAAAHLLA